MTMKHAFLTVSISAFFVAAAASSSTAAPLRPADLVAAADRYLNKTVEVDIVEPLYGPATPAALASAQYGQVEIMDPDGMGNHLGLVPAAFKPEDANRYRNKFDRVIPTPVRVKGELLKDNEMTESMHRPYYVIRVSSWEPLSLGEPTKLPSLDQVAADPAKWDRKSVVYEGIYENRFEVSAIDGKIWLSFQEQTQRIGQPSPPAGGKSSDRVRVTGILFSKPGSRYGHLGGYPFEILASKVEYLK